MNHPVYEVNYSQKEDRYVFESIGKKGIILKVVKFVELQGNIYNLGFGDFDPNTNQVDDIVVTDNGDTVKVLATIVSIVIDFLSKNPTSFVFFEGSTESRTRLYQIAINLYYNEFIKMFEMYGLNNGQPESFQKNKSYESFLIKKMF